MGKVGSCSLEELEKANWKSLLPESKLQADHQHYFKSDELKKVHATHVKLRIFSRWRCQQASFVGESLMVFESSNKLTLEHLNKLPRPELHQEFFKCCSSMSWVENLAKRRPFKNMIHLVSEAQNVWETLGERDWLEAFLVTPKLVTSLLLKRSMVIQVTGRLESKVVLE